MTVKEIKIQINLSRWIKIHEDDFIHCSLSYCKQQASKELVEIQESTNKRFKPFHPVYLCQIHLNDYLQHENELLQELNIPLIPYNTKIQRRLFDHGY